MSKQHVTMTVNGDPVEVLCRADQTLLDCLRDEMGLTGTKKGAQLVIVEPAASL